MQSIQDLIKTKENLKKEVLEKRHYISQEFQDYGFRIASKLGTLSQLSMYIKLAKDKPRALLEQAFSFAIDYPNATNKGKIFMWKLKELELERFERMKAKNSKLKIIVIDINALFNTPINAFIERYQSQFMLLDSDIESFKTEDYPKCIVGKKDLKKALKKYIKNWNWQGDEEDLIKYWFSDTPDINMDIIDRLNGLDREVYKIYVSGDYDKYQAEYLERAITTKLNPDGFLQSFQIGVESSKLNYIRRVLNNLMIDVSQIHYLAPSTKSLSKWAKLGCYTYQYPIQGIDEIIKNVGSKS